MAFSLFENSGLIIAPGLMIRTIKYGRLIKLGGHNALFLLDVSINLQSLGVAHRAPSGTIMVEISLREKANKGKLTLYGRAIRLHGIGSASSARR
jgi:hypothetical protein